MFCTQCGTQLDDDSRFCYKCGTPTHLAEQKDSIEENTYTHATPNVTAPTQQQAQPQSTVDEGAFGIVGFILAFFFPLIGMIISIVGLTKKKNTGLALAGFILSLAFILIIVIAVVAIVVYRY